MGQEAKAKAKKAAKFSTQDFAWSAIRIAVTYKSLHGLNLNTIAMKSGILSQPFPLSIHNRREPSNSNSNFKSNQERPKEPDLREHYSRAGWPPLKLHKIQPASEPGLSLRIISAGLDLAI
jgi:hypothetical protein